MYWTTWSKAGFRHKKAQEAQMIFLSFVPFVPFCGYSSIDAWTFEAKLTRQRQECCGIVRVGHR